MAIESIIKVNVIGKTEYTDNFSRDVFFFKDVQLINAMDEIDAGRLTLPVSKENITEMLGLAKLTPGDEIVDSTELNEMVQVLSRLYDDQLQFDNDFVKNHQWDMDELKSRSQIFLDFAKDKFKKSDDCKKRLDEIQTSIEAYRYIKDIDVPMSDLDQMKFFNYTLGSVSKDNAARLKSIYNTVTSVVFHVGNSENEEVFLIISPTELEVETDRILKSLGFKPIEGLDPQYTKRPRKVLRDLEKEQEELEKQIALIDRDRSTFCKQHKREAGELYSYLSLFINADAIKKKMAFSSRNFYFSGWIPTRGVSFFKDLPKKYPGMIVQFPKDDSYVRPPTKFRNNWLIRPFETLVKMYGVPSYGELDPTPFLSITYLFCFGYMFGDVGQGLVLLILGMILGKRGSQLGEVMSRMACSSIIFGFIYGSFFGNENLLPTLWVRPFQNINTILITAVVCGVAMLFAAYVYSVINKIKAHDIKEGLFGSNGVAGFALYICLLLLVLCSLNYIPGGSSYTHLLGIISIVLIFVVLFREPIANTILHRKLYDTTAGDYYVEAGFGLFEMLLGMLSNTLSFIRVGAFALTHVGLFMAFETLASMVGGGFGGIIVLILGNILIIVLEGLIDFIQCLRLQFYELFSKYYSGNGTEFVPIGTEIN